MKLQISIDGRTYDIDVEVTEEDYAPRGRSYLLPYPETPTTISLPGGGTGAPAAAKAEGPVDEEKVCRSPVAGMVIRVDVQPGQKVEAGGQVMVLEAMKMETNVVAPVAGTVKAIKAAQGDGVKVNQVLVEFE
ncbi:MAG: acetyl-CoA carboxylase biotin carboxyl carrier protein subunit [Alphaproteobacteria bacterium]|nr:acetyl-CoA carboxylase biotin carboxyl carrier protein subunit [Alphaproteobacteria bacterium]